MANPLASVLVCLFEGTTNSKPIKTLTLTDALEQIRSGMYRRQVEQLRQILAEQGKDAYSVEKRKLLAAFTPCGTFAPSRAKTHLTHHSGIVHGDLDHLAKQKLRTLKAALASDPRTVYVLDSPSWEGLKLGVHVPIVADDAAYKHAWQAVVTDYEQLYGVPWDASGKDVSRLCYVSYDPELYTNFEAICFDVPPMPAPLPKPAPQKVTTPTRRTRARSTDRRDDYAQQATETATKIIDSSQPGNRHMSRLKAARLLGGYVAGEFLSYDQAYTALEIAVERNTDDFDRSMKTIADGLAHGQSDKITLEDLQSERQAWLDSRGYTSNGHRPGSHTISDKKNSAPGEAQPPPNDEDDQLRGESEPKAPASKPKAPASKPGWIMRNKRIITCQHNALLWLEEQGYTKKISLDTFLQVIKVDGEPLSDELVIDMVRRMEASEAIRWADTHVRNALVNLGNRHKASSLTTWLDSLSWDKESRIWKFFRTVYGSEDSDYAAMCGQVLFLSAVARAYEPGCKADVMVVLIGDQGLGKSKGIEELVPEQGWYTDDLGGDLSDRKAGEGLQGKWIIEFSEFARINRATIDVVKSFLSRRVDHYRPPYGRTPKDFLRQCVFVGTTNNPIPLQDIENRRYMPIRCSRYSGDIPAQREQLWAEAVQRYKDGMPWWVTDDKLLAIVKAQQDGARQHDEWEDVLRETLSKEETVTLTDVAVKLNISMDRLDKGNQTRLGIVMKAIGFQRKRATTGGTDRVRHYYWERVSPKGESEVGQR